MQRRDRRWCACSPGRWHGHRCVCRACSEAFHSHLSLVPCGAVFCSGGGAAPSRVRSPAVSLQRSRKTTAPGASSHRPVWTPGPGRRHNGAHSAAIQAGATIAPPGWHSRCTGRAQAGRRDDRRLAAASASDGVLGPWAAQHQRPPQASAGPLLHDHHHVGRLFASGWQLWMFGLPRQQSLWRAVPHNPLSHPVPAYHGHAE